MEGTGQRPQRFSASYRLKDMRELRRLSMCVIGLGAMLDLQGSSIETD